METIEIQSIGKLKVKSGKWAMTTIKIVLILRLPILLIGALSTGTAIVLALYPVEAFEDIVNYKLFAAVVGIVLLAIGNLMKFIAVRFFSKFIHPYTWYVSMQKATIDNANDFYSYAINLKECKSTDVQDMILISFGLVVVAMQNQEVKKNWDELLNISDYILEHGYNSDIIKINKALALEKLSRYEEAISICDEIISINSEPIPDSYFIKANALIRLNQLDSAIILLNEIQNIYSKSLCSEEFIETIKESKSSIDNAIKVNKSEITSIRTFAPLYITLGELLSPKEFIEKLINNCDPIKELLQSSNFVYYDKSYIDKLATEIIYYTSSKKMDLIIKNLTYIPKSFRNILVTTLKPQFRKGFRKDLIFPLIGTPLAILLTPTLILDFFNRKDDIGNTIFLSVIDIIIIFGIIASSASCYDNHKMLKILKNVK
jgi:tetratricopeptide (TPR) repeat protein